MSPVHARDVQTSLETDARLVPASVLFDIPDEVNAIATMIGVRVTQLEPMRGGALQAELDVPPGFWRVWPEHSLALWIGRTSDASMPHVGQQHLPALDLVEALLRLHRAGMWLQEARLLVGREWTGSAPLESLISALRTHDDRVVGVAGFWGDGAGHVVEAQIFRWGEIRASSPMTAVRWLETAYGLND